MTLRRTTTRLRVLQLEDVLDRPRCAPPGGILRQEVVLDGDVARNHARNADVRAAEHDVLARGLEVVVADDERARRVPRGNRLGVLPDRLDVANVGVRDRDVGGVGGDRPLLPDGRIAGDEDPIELDVVRHRASVVWSACPRAMMSPEPFLFASNATPTMR